MRKTIVAAWVLVLGISLTGGHALADTSGGKTPPKQAPKGKAGDGCKADNDCDQSGRPLRCRDNKCGLAPVHPVT